MADEEQPPPELADTLGLTGAGTTPSTAAPPAPLPQWFGTRYHVLAELGRGGMGTVYRVHDVELDEEAALKTLNPQLAADRQAVLRFRQEVKLARRVTHRNIARIYDLHVTDDGPFLTMELIRGRGLDALMAEGALALDVVIDVAAQILAALEAAHTAGVVHRDLKPSNVMVTRERVVLTDFGIATVAGLETRNQMLGTPYYVAPEQARGLPVDGRADLYSLGAMLFEMLSGAPPWTAATPLGVVMRRLVEEPPDLGPPAPPTARKLVRQLMAREPSGRPASARVVADALRAGFAASGTIELPALPSPSNLPATSEQPVGREAEVRAVTESLVRRGIVCVTGIGGIGKTRLAQAVARAVSDDFPGGVWFVELRGVTNLAEIRTRLGVALGIGPGDDARLTNALCGCGPALLILDGLEDVPARLVFDEVARLRGVDPPPSVVLTSRASARPPDAALLKLGPLSVEAGVELFLRRARDVAPAATNDPSTVAEIVRRVDGVPLAIELAASRLKIMSAEDLEVRLTDQLRLLRTSNPREPRHATMETVLAESWRLLSAPAAVALAELSVFRGGARLDAACEVLERASVFAEDLIEELTEHSLVQWDPGRQRLLVPALVHAYAVARLAELPEEVRDDARRQHLRVLRTRAREHIEAVGARATSRDWSDELENWIAAFDTAVEVADGEAAVEILRAIWDVLDRRGPFETALALCDRLETLMSDDDDQWVGWVRAGALWRMGRLDEAASCAERFLEMTGNPEARARLELTLANILWAQGQSARAAPLLDEVIRGALHTGDVRLRGTAQGNRGLVAWNNGDLVAARQDFEAARRLQAELGDVRSEAIALSNLALVDHDEGNVERAIETLREAISMHRAADDARSEALARNNLGNMLLAVGQVDAAEVELEAALAQNRRLGNQVMVGYCLANLGKVSLHRARYDEAHTRLSTAMRVHEDASDAHSRGMTGAVLARVLAALGRDEEARDAFAAAIEVLENLGHNIELARALVLSAQFEHERQQPAVARAQLERALSLAPDLPKTDLAHVIDALRSPA